MRSFAYLTAYHVYACGISS